MSSKENASAPGHYIVLTVAILVGLVGVYLRFLGDAPIYSILSNIILVLGTILALRTVFAIMK